jgi:GT2 family glycosyltransferase
LVELSALFVNYNSWRLLVQALRSLRANAPARADGTPIRYEVIVVDNASPQRDAAAEGELEALLATMHGRLIRHHENGGYSKGMNLAYAQSRGAVILVSNPDVLYQPRCVDRLVRYLEEHEDAGAVMPSGYWDEAMHGHLPPNILPTLGDLIAVTLADVSPFFVRRYSARRTRDALRIWAATAPVDLDMLSGCCFVMRRSLIERIGFFDERFPLYYEDTDLSLRIRRAGKRIVQLHDARLVHLYNRSAQTNHRESMQRYWVSRELYYRKWYGWPGHLLYRLTRWFLSTRWAKRRAQLPPHDVIHDCGTSNDKPTLQLPASYGRYLVEGALDPRFYLACGIFGSGDTWTPSDSLFKGFGPTTYFWRVLDVSDPAAPKQVGVYRHTLTYPTRQMEPVR